MDRVPQSGLGARAISGAGAATSHGRPSARILAMARPPAPERRQDELAGLDVQPALGLQARRSGVGQAAQAALVPDGSHKERGTQPSATTKREQEQGCCPDPENYHDSREETKGQIPPKKTGEGGRRGHLAGILKGGAVTVGLPASSPKGQFPSGTAQLRLRSHRHHPFRPPPPPGPRTPAIRLLQGPEAECGAIFLWSEFPGRPSPTRLPSQTKPTSHLAAPAPAASPHSAVGT